jgi:hypothetical protein
MVARDCRRRAKPRPRQERRENSQKQLARRRACRHDPVGEGQPAPSLQANFAHTPLGPVRKILVLSAISEELQDASPQNAAQVIGRVLSDATNKSVDSIAFDANPDDGIRPAGLLNGVAPIVASAGTDTWSNMVSDVSNLVEAIGNAGIDASETIFITRPREAMLLRMRTGPDFVSSVYSSIGLPSGTVIAVAPQGLASGYRGPPTIETGKQGSWQFADSNPAEIVGTGGAVADGPVISAFQNYLISIKVRANAAWCAGAVQVVQNVQW